MQGMKVDNQVAALNQGNSSTCVCHALANAIDDQLKEDGIKVDRDYVAKILVNYNQHTEGVWPDKFDHYPKKILVKKVDSDDWVSIKIKDVKSVPNFNEGKRHILAYYAYEQSVGHYFHCVFVKEKRDNTYVCVNSWGEHDKHPAIDINQHGNMLWIVQCEPGLAKQGVRDSVLTMPLSNLPFRKLQIEMAQDRELWRHLSFKFALPKEVVQDIEQRIGSGTNASGMFVDMLLEDPDLTINCVIQAFKEIPRAKRKLEQLGAGKTCFCELELHEAQQLHPLLIGNPRNPLIKNWKDAANELGMTSDIDVIDNIMTSAYSAEQGLFSHLKRANKTIGTLREKLVEVDDDKTMSGTICVIEILDREINDLAFKEMVNLKQTYLETGANWQDDDAEKPIMVKEDTTIWV